MKHRAKDLAGRSFGKWTVVRRDEAKRFNWICRCECGVTKSVYSYNMLSGYSQSCGCSSLDNMKQRKGWKHGMAGTREHGVWSRMIRRCHDEKCSDYQYYGGRGISVCERWRGSFLAFMTDMGPRPIGKTLERIDNDGPYSPENCRWASMAEQGLNTRRNRVVSAFGRTMTLKETAEAYQIDYMVLFCRIRRGWPVEMAITLPVRPGVSWKNRQSEPPQITSLPAKQAVSTAS